MERPVQEANQLLGLSAVMLRAMGVWRPPGDGPPGARLLVAVVVLLYNSLLSLSCTAQLLLDPPADREKSREVVFLAMCGVSWLVRVASFMLHWNQIQRLVLLLLESRSRFEEKASGIRDRYRRRVVLLGFIWQVLPFVPLLLWVLDPMLASRRRPPPAVNATDARVRPLMTWVPMDVQASPAYELTYLVQAVGFLTVADVNVLLDSFFVSLLMSITAELAVLNENICGLLLAAGDAPTCSAAPREQALHVSVNSGCSSALAERNAGSQCQRQLYAALVKNVRHHQIIMICVNELESAMSNTTYYVLLVTALNICFQSFGFVEIFQGGAQWSSILKRLLALPVYLSRAGFYCLSGQAIIDQSENLLHSAFSCGWPDASASFCRALLIFMKQASRPLTLQVGKIVTLSRHWFLQLLNASYTIFNMLLSL